MSIILTYLFCFISIIIVAETGIIFRNNSLSQFSKDEGIGSTKKIIGCELAKTLSNQSDLKNIKISKLNAKKTNYYSVKYNVIKLSPITHNSYELSQLSIATHCFRQAKFAQKNTLFNMLYIVVNFISKLISGLYLPAILILSITMPSKSESLKTKLLLALLATYIVVYLIELAIYFIKKARTQQIVKDLEKTNLFDNDELYVMSNQLKCICKLEFFDYSFYTFFLFKILNLDNIFKQK